MILLDLMTDWSSVAVQTEPITAIAAWIIPTILGALSAGGSIGSAALSARASKNANANIKDAITEQQEKNEQWWQQKQNENYLDSAEAQAAIGKAREMAQEQMANARGVQAVMGGTGASVAAAQQNANKMLSDTISGIAATSTARKDMAEQTYINRNNDLARQLINAYGERAAQNASAGSSALSALGSIGSSLITAFGGASK